MKLKAFLQNDVVSTILWVGLSAAITAICSAILQMPELTPYYGIVNIVLYSLKVANDQRKK